MDIYELDSYRLSDAVKFHTDLNPALWDGDKMRPEVRTALLRVADDFREFLGIDDLAVEDITVSGSNAAYSYTPHSDIDLHLIVDFSKLNPDQVYQELFNAKKYQYNDQHDIKVRGYDVELYVQDSNKPVRSLGEYSLKDNDWTRIPVRRRGNLDEKSTKAKYEKLRDLIELALKSDDLEKITSITDTIKKYRQAGLDQAGEFGPENLAFKMLRTQGLIKRLWDHRADLEDARLSLAERKKKKKKKSRKPFTYGAFGGWFYPGYNNDSGATGDAGGDGGGGESVQEQQESQNDVIDRFMASCCDFLGMEQRPRLKLRRDPQWSKVNGTFGRYDPDTHTVELAIAGRHIVDVLRTLAHEMTHARQNEVVELPDDAGETGSSYEDSANAMAGRIMRHWADQEPEMFAGHQLDEQLDRPTPTAQEIIRKHGITEKDFIRQLKMGMKVELEHTTDARAAMEIAMDHINERPDYYDMLAAVERPMGEGIGIQVPVSKDPKHLKQYYDFIRGKQQMNRPLTKQEQQFLMTYRATQNMKVAEDDIDEDWRKAAGAAAAAACIAGTPGCATTGTNTMDVLKGVQTVGRAAQSVKSMGRAGAEEELKGAIRDALRRQRGQIPEASGYIPTEKQKNDPRFKTALTVDIHPGQTGKEANKLGLKTDSQGRPDLLMKNLANLLESVKAGDDEDLMEVEMSPSAFRKFLNSDAAEGIRAGFEAELIFRDTQHDPDEGEPEPDYDMDERTGSIDDVIDFFTSGDNGIGRTAADRLRNQMYEQFDDWVRETFYDEFFSQDRFREWCDDNIWPKVDDDYREDARKYLEDVEDNAEPDDEAIEKTAVRLFHDDVERDWDRSGDWWDEAQEELYDEYYGEADQSEWLESAGMPYMSDVANEWGYDWPYWTEGGAGGGSREWGDIADSLQRVTGMPVRVSGGYHGAARREGQYIIEPDSSLDADDSEDYGLEVVSPPMPLPEAIEQLNRIIDWANADGDAYTNSSTGIHMGVSLPFKGGDVDPIKLVLFMGDKNILETFGRESNHYARSAYDRIQDKIRAMKNAGPKRIEGVMELMKKNLIELADRELQRGGLGDKYVSVHPQDGYIEFRGPGGDYLSKNDEVEGVLENTMLRLAYAMSIAGRPDLYRKEYAKKLYKVLTTGDKGNPFMQMFSDYSAGTLTGEELKTKWADTVLRMEQGEEEDEDVPMGVAQEYEVYDRDTGEVYQTFTAYNDDEALLRFRARYRDQYAQPGRLPVLRVKAPERKSKAKPSRRAELAKRVTRSTRDVGEQLWVVNFHSKIRRVVARSQAEAIEKASMLDRDFDHPEARARLADRQEIETYRIDQERERERQRDSDQDAAQIRGRLGVPQPAGSEFTGTWIIRDGQGRELHRFSGIGNSQHDANRFAAGWLGRNRPSMVGQEVEVTPEMR